MEREKMGGPRVARSVGRSVRRSLLELTGAQGAVDETREACASGSGVQRVRHWAAALFGALLCSSNLGAGCPGEPPPLDLPGLATTTAVGTFSGSTSVSDDGTFSFTAPIPIPPGRAGMQPSLALGYASTSAEGSLGVGFRIEGLSSMARCGQTVAVDERHRGVELDDEDRLCIDGARLLAVEGVDMGPSATYRTEVESWRRVQTIASDSGGISGPVTFLVTMADGRERLYGGSESSRLVLTRPDGARAVMTWYLTQERDPRGNTILYEYEHLTPTLPPRLAAAMDPDPPLRDTVRISRIWYTGTSTSDGGASVRGTRSIRFTYAADARIPDTGSPEPGSPDPGLIETPTPEDGFLEGTFGWRASTFPLERVRTYVGEELVHELRLVGDSDNSARRYRLSSAAPS